MATKNNTRTTATSIKSLFKSGKVGKHSVGNSLYFRISDEGTGSWVVRYAIHRRRREITIGDYPAMSLADANGETALIKLEVKKGVDPLAERQRADNTQYQIVDDLAEDWLQDCDKRLKYSSIPRRVYKKDIAPYVGRLAIDQVTPRDIRAIINKITKSGRPTVSNDALMYCKQLFRHGLKLGLLVHNPAEPFSVSDAGGVEKSRSRALSFDEIKQVFESCRKHHNQFSRENYLAIALLVTLGVRKGELIAAKWEEFEMDEQLWHIPEGRSKNGKPISIPLPKEAIEWFHELFIRASGSEFVFPKRRVSKRQGHISPDTINAALQKMHREEKLGVEHFTIHDLRRTFRSLMAREGIPGHVAERCLNHSLKGVEGIYDRYDYLDERREALQKMSKILVPIINDGEKPLFS